MPVLGPGVHPCCLCLCFSWNNVLVTKRPNSEQRLRSLWPLLLMLPTPCLPMTFPQILESELILALKSPSTIASPFEVPALTWIAASQNSEPGSWAVWVPHWQIYFHCKNEVNQSELSCSLHFVWAHDKSAIQYLYTGDQLLTFEI